MNCYIFVVIISKRLSRDSNAEFLRVCKTRRNGNMPSPPLPATHMFNTGDRQRQQIIEPGSAHDFWDQMYARKKTIVRVC